MHASATRDHLLVLGSAHSAEPHLDVVTRSYRPQYLAIVCGTNAREEYARLHTHKALRTTTGGEVLQQPKGGPRP